MIAFYLYIWVVRRLNLEVCTIHIFSTLGQRVLTNNCLASIEILYILLYFGKQLDILGLCLSVVENCSPGDTQD